MINTPANSYHGDGIHMVFALDDARSGPRPALVAAPAAIC